MPDPNTPPKPDIKALAANFMTKGFELAKEITHQEFVEAVNAKKMVYELQLKNQTKILKRSRLIIFSIYVTMYLLFPAVFISIYTYRHSNAMLLTGIIFSTIGTLFASRSPKLGFFLTMILLGWWAYSGFHFRSYPMFYLLWLWWGYIWFNIANGAEAMFIKEALLTDSDLYHKLAENDLIFLMREPET